MQELPHHIHKVILLLTEFCMLSSRKKISGTVGVKMMLYTMTETRSEAKTISPAARLVMQSASDPSLCILAMLQVPCCQQY